MSDGDVLYIHPEGAGGGKRARVRAESEGLQRLGLLGLKFCVESCMCEARQHVVVLQRLTMMKSFVSCRRKWRWLACTRIKTAPLPFGGLGPGGLAF